MILEPLNKEELEKIFDVPARQVIQYFLEKTLMLQPELKPNQEVLLTYRAMVCSSIKCSICRCR